MNKGFYLILFFYFSAIFTSIILLYSFYKFKDTVEFENIALGEGTRTVEAFVKNEKVHCLKLSNIKTCIDPASKRKKKASILWLGNSQLHAINQPKISDNPVSAIAAKELRRYQLDLLTFSQPNANLTEHYILFEMLYTLYPFEMLILPAVFDDTREQTIRQDVRLALGNSSVISILKKSDIGKKVIEITNEKMKNDKQTIQDRSEESISMYLEKCCQWERLREQIRGSISLSLYKLRNFIFRITPNSVRGKVTTIYEQNMLAFEATLKSARTKNVKVLVYIPPLRSDVKIPYDLNEYQQFTKEVSALSNSLGANFVNLQQIVPGNLWGLKESTNMSGKLEYDFMHFQAKGHKILAKHIVENVLRIRDDF